MWGSGRVVQRRSSSLTVVSDQMVYGSGQKHFDLIISDRPFQNPIYHHYLLKI